MSDAPENLIDSDDRGNPHARRTSRLGIRSLSAAAVFIPFFAATYSGAYLLRFAGEDTTRYWPIFMSTLAVAVGLKWLIFTWFRVYDGWTRYVTFHDLLVLGK